MTACPRCRAPMQPGQRFEAHGVVGTLVCWDGCGYEAPPFDACCERAEVVIPPPKPAPSTDCQQCGAPLTARQRKREQRNCSWRCRFGVERRPAVVRDCPCGREFPAYPSDIERGKRLYCSQSCASRYQRKRAAA